MPNPSYLDVCARITGHAEVAQVTFDSLAISYEDLLDIFWAIHDPTSLNCQGADRGEQYRSVIFYHTSKQRSLAIHSKLQLEQTQIYNRPIVTEIKPASQYYLATNEHQHYFEKKGNPLPQALKAKLPQRYWNLVVLPFE